MRASFYGRSALAEPASEQPVELPAPVLAHSARDRRILPNTSTYQYCFFLTAKTFKGGHEGGADTESFF